MYKYKSYDLRGIRTRSLLLTGVRKFKFGDILGT
jgi:hypothetical protein